MKVKRYNLSRSIIQIKALMTHHIPRMMTALAFVVIDPLSPKNYDFLKQETSHHGLFIAFHVCGDLIRSDKYEHDE